MTNPYDANKGGYPNGLSKEPPAADPVDAGAGDAGGVIASDPGATVVVNPAPGASYPPAVPSHPYPAAPHGHPQSAAGPSYPAVPPANPYAPAPYGYSAPPPNYPGPPPGYGQTPGYAPLPPTRRAPVGLIIAAIVGSVVVLVAGFGLKAFAASKGSEDTGPLAYPAVGTCIDHHGGDVMHESIPALDCANPAATKRIVASEIVTDTDREVECTDIQSLIITTGKHHGDVVTAHTCAAPNVIVGHCYQASVNDFTYDPACTDGSARFDRVVRGVQDTEQCKTPTEDVGRQMDMVILGKFHFVNKEENATYCFALPD
ncbi:hypothetical protein [Nocardia cyriacigeorgica]|uniref:hypothetical protein n=1 Tax=Nocardia cyriacigeorgica TaxID=135487 RepID=UPI0024581127|nr:hypothetical protein [Nocardia cyriacigeorgica]